MAKEKYVAPQAEKIEFCYDEHVVASGSCYDGTIWSAHAGNCESEDIYSSASRT